MAKKYFFVLGKTLEKADRINGRINPLNQRINKGTTTDTGTESAKLVNDVVKKGKQTVRAGKATVKTAKRTVKTVKNAPKNIRKTATAVKKTTKATVKATKILIKVTKEVVSVFAKVAGKIIAWLIANPIVLVIVIIVIILIFTITYCVSIAAGGEIGSQSTASSFSFASGLKDVPKELEKAMKELEEYKKDKKKEYDKWIDSFYYDRNHKDKSDLLYMDRFDKDNTPTQYFFYEGSKRALLCTDDVKNQLKSALDWNCGIDDYEIIANAYVIAEIEMNKKNSKKENPDEEKTYVIADVKITKDHIKKVVDTMVRYGTAKNSEGNDCITKNCSCTGLAEVTSDNPDDWQRLESLYCSWESRKEENPEWSYWNRMKEWAESARDAWFNNVYNTKARETYYKDYSHANSAAQSGYYNANIKPLIDAWNDQYRYSPDGQDWIRYGLGGEEGYSFYSSLWDTAESYSNYLNSLNRYKEYRFYSCHKQHTEYDNYLEFFNIEEVEKALGFSETEILWKDLTKQYFNNLILEAEGK